MGYYTKFDLAVVDGPPAPLGDILREYIGYIDDDPEWGYLAQSIKWYSHEQDLTEISLKYPDTVFVLDGAGEEPGDVWRKVFQNGRCEVWRADVEPPDWRLILNGC